MGRFYNTARSIFVDDKMFELPAELMGKVIQAQDKGVDENIEKVDAFNESLKVENLKTDDPAVNQALQNYKDKIDQLTNDIYKNPLDYRRFRGQIGNISRELDADLNKGILGKAQEQLTSFNTEMDRISKLDNVGSNKKDLIKRVIQDRYKKQGGLAFQDENTYNQISDLFETPLEDVDTEALINTIASNFTADTTASASAGPDGRGYIWTSKGTVEIRNEEDVAKYMENALSEEGWEDQLRQELEWRKELGEEIDVDNEVQRQKQAVIDQAKNKLGYRKETSAKSVSVDGLYTFKQAQRERQQRAMEGFIIEDERDYRKALTSDGKRKYSDAQIDKFENETRGKMIQLGQKIGIDDLDTFKKEYFATPGKSINSIMDELADTGLTKQEVIAYINYQNDNKVLKTPHIPGYDEMTEEQKDANPDMVRKQQTYLTTVVNGMNGMNNNDKVKSIIIYEDGVPQEKSYNTMAELIQDNDNYVFIPATGTVKTEELQKDTNGNLIDEDGDVLMDSTGKPIKSYAAAVRNGVGGDVVYKPASVPTYDTDASLLKFDAGNVKEFDNFEIKNNGMVDTSGVYVGNNKFFRVNKETGERKLIETEVQVDKKDLRVNFK